jgi:hypothetical protein
MSNDSLLTMVKKFLLNAAKDKAAEKWRKNPRIKLDIFEYVIPGAVAFVGTHVAMNLGQRYLKKAPPAWARLGSGAVIATGLWFAVHHLKFAKKYHSPAVIGTALALAVEAIKTFAPSMGSLVGVPAVQGQLATPQAQEGWVDSLPKFERAPAPAARGVTTIAPPRPIEVVNTPDDDVQELVDEGLPDEWNGWANASS